MNPNQIDIGDAVRSSPTGAGKITGVTPAGYPQVNGVAVTWVERVDGARYDPHARIGGSRGPVHKSLQEMVEPWMLETFGAEIAADKAERNHRFLEESLELVQACGCSKSDAHSLVDYVYGRPEGDRAQEVGGVMITLAALCLAQGLDMDEAGEAELGRIWTKVPQIRAKQAAKPHGSPLPAGGDGAKPTTTPLYLHVKSGNAYAVMCEAQLEADQTPMVVYRSINSEQVWVRPKSEFMDGRFARVGGAVVDVAWPADPEVRFGGPEDIEDPEDVVLARAVLDRWDRTRAATRLVMGLFEKASQEAGGA